MLDHFFVSSCDGALHDTRDLDWSAKPLRANYKRTHGNIRTAADFKATIRAGGFAWPGGYPLYLICDDGAALCFVCGRKEARYIISSIADRANDGWRVVACDVNYEDNDLYCDNCSQQIESAYGDD